MWSFVQKRNQHEGPLEAKAWRFPVIIILVFFYAFVKNIIVFSVYTSRPNKLLCCSSNGNKPQFLGMTIQTKSRWFSESFQIGVTPRRVLGFPKYMNTLECCWFFSLNCSWVATAASEKLECKNHNKHAILLQKFAKYAHSCRKRIGAYIWPALRDAM